MLIGILQGVLNGIVEPKAIQNTICKLPVQFVLPLIKEVKKPSIKIVNVKAVNPPG